MRRYVLAAVTVLFIGSSARGDLIVNGSFEMPPVPAGGYINYPGGSTDITGWRVVGVDATVASGSFSQNGILFQAQAGGQWIDLTAVTSNSSSNGVAQDVATTIGQLYELSFYVGSATDNSLYFPATVDLSIDGGARVSYTNPNATTSMLDWRLFAVRFAATRTTTTLTFYNGSAPNNYLSALDNVSLVAVPEPSSLVSAALGLVALAGYAGWRRGHLRPC